MSEHRVLFLCTGNYYRSRFAEEYFNHLATQRKSRWRADSSALDLAYARTVTVGPISCHAIAGLNERGIPAPSTWREPKQACADELAMARIVVAMKETEHRPMVQRLFAELSARVIYWHIDDIDAATPVEALAQVERHVRELFEQLHSSEAGGTFR